MDPPSTFVDTFQISFIPSLVIGVTESDTPGERTFPVQYDQLEPPAGSYVFLESRTSSTGVPSGLCPAIVTSPFRAVKVYSSTVPSEKVTKTVVSPSRMPVISIVLPLSVSETTAVVPSGDWIPVTSPPRMVPSNCTEYPMNGWSSSPPGAGPEPPSPLRTAYAPAPPETMTAARINATILMFIPSNSCFRGGDVAARVPRSPSRPLRS